jgi:hypothetical protein
MATDEPNEWHGDVVILHHIAYLGLLSPRRKHVRWAKVEPLPDSRRLWISYKEARQRNSRHYTVGDDNDYFSIVVGGRLVWDSRAVVPCDMAKWYETFKDFK